MFKELDNCPHCGVGLSGEPIPAAIREHYGSSTHWRREIGIYSREEDRTVAYKCPDCGGYWGRDGKIIEAK